MYFDRIIEHYLSCKYCTSRGEAYWNDYGQGPVRMFGCNQYDCRSTYPIDPETIKGWKVNDTVILRSLVESLGMKENMTEVVTDEIWKLGRRQRREYFFIRSVGHDDLPQLMAMFANQPKAVLITTRDTGVDTLKQFIMANTCFSLDELGTFGEAYRIVFDVERIGAIVGTPAVEEESASQPKRASRAASIESLTEIMKDHIRAVCEHADFTGRNGQFEFIPRPTQAELAKMAKIPQYEVSRCLNDPTAVLFKLLWEKAEAEQNLEFLRNLAK